MSLEPNLRPGARTFQSAWEGDFIVSRESLRQRREQGAVAWRAFLSPE